MATSLPDPDELRAGLDELDGIELLMVLAGPGSPLGDYRPWMSEALREHLQVRFRATLRRPVSEGRHGLLAHAVVEIVEDELDQGLVGLGVIDKSERVHHAQASRLVLRPENLGHRRHAVHRQGVPRLRGSLGL